MTPMTNGDQSLGAERRSKPRSLVSVPLSMYGSNRRLLLRARTVDLSAAGALVHGSAPLRIGQVVHVEVPRGSARNPLTLRAEVVRISMPDARRKQHGVALRFTELSPLDEAILESIIEAAKG